MKVYVLFHADIEDDRYVRGVYATEALATEALIWDEYHEYSGRGSWSRHNEHCCGVDEMELLDHLELPFHGPEPYEVGKGRGGRIFSPAIADALASSVFEQSIYRVALVDNGRPIGRVTRVTEDENGATIEGEFNP